MNGMTEYFANWLECPGTAAEVVTYGQTYYRMKCYKYGAGTLAYASSMIKSSAKIGKNCIGDGYGDYSVISNDDWSCMGYIGYTGNKLFSTMGDVYGVYYGCMADVDGGSAKECSYQVAMTAFDAAATYFYTMITLDYCFAESSEPAEEEHEEEEAELEEDAELDEDPEY